jgi:hypothetical protein
MRESIEGKSFPEFVDKFMKKMYPEERDLPRWISDALASVNITIKYSAHS